MQYKYSHQKRLHVHYIGRTNRRERGGVFLNIFLKPTQIAPDFEAEALLNGEKINLRLSDYRDQWVLLFFYASDFTFV